MNTCFVNLFQSKILSLLTFILGFQLGIFSNGNFAYFNHSDDFQSSKSILGIVFYLNTMFLFPLIILIFFSIDSQIEVKNITNSKTIRILCWVATYPQNHNTKAVHVKLTWGKRCDKLIFMSSINGNYTSQLCNINLPNYHNYLLPYLNLKDSTLPSVNLNVPENRKNLWMKTRAAFKYVYDKFRYLP